MLFFCSFFKNVVTKRQLQAKIGCSRLQNSIMSKRCAKAQNYTLFINKNFNYVKTN